MRNHFHLWKWIHVITNLTADSFANMLHVIKSFDNAIVVYTEEEGATQAIGKSTYTLQPALGFLLFKHNFEIVCGTFRYQTIQFPYTFSENKLQYFA